MRYTSPILQRVLIPSILVLAATFRPVGISFVYLLMFFISPFVPIATAENFNGGVSAYFIILLALIALLLVCHVVLQLTIMWLSIEHLFGTCSFIERLLRHIGFIDFRNLNYLAVVEWLAPEVCVLITTAAVFIITKKLVRSTTVTAADAGESIGEGPSVGNIETGSNVVSTTVGIRKPLVYDKINFDALIKISPFFCLLSIFFAAVLRPSVPGAFYFLIFLISGTYWATYKRLERGFVLMMRLVMAVLVVHIILIVSYQTPWAQQMSKGNSSNLIERLLALEALVTSSCAKDIRIIFFDKSYQLVSYLSPLVILLSYYILALTTSSLIKKKIVSKTPEAPSIGHQHQQQQQQTQQPQQQQPQQQRQQQQVQQLENGNKINRQVSIVTQTSKCSKRDSWTKTQRFNVSIGRDQRSREPTETTPLVRHRHKTERELTAETISGTKSGTSFIDGNPSGDIPLDTVPPTVDGIVDDATLSLCDQICYGFISVGKFIYQNSYIFTNILMMTWSIVYHSWLTFVLLLWANVLWMIPNQRKAMMRSSGFIVFYAEILIVAQYLYGMNLTNDELPENVDTAGVNLAQIGLERPQSYGVQPCIPLMVKTLFLLMFWITLRQFCKEKSEKRPRKRRRPSFFITGADHATPRRQKKTSKFLKTAGDVIKNVLVRLWIWLVLLVIFLCAITGTTMSGFRICYMALFLFFLLVFQTSSAMWINIMYGFWMFLIFYAMSILILIYTYQFDDFDEYWEVYLNISETIQKDIGLERFETKDLFLHLVSPTLIVILTVIQVHYFHKRFVASVIVEGASSRFVLPSPSVVSPDVASSLSGQTVSEDDNRKEANIIEPPEVLVTFTNIIYRIMKTLKSQFKKIVKNFKNFSWNVLEMHFIKLAYVWGFYCCAKEVSILHIPFVTACLLGTITKNQPRMFFSRIIALVVSFIILTKMIYQVSYLNHEVHNTGGCTNKTNYGNNAVWFGLNKVNPEDGLMGLLKGYIIFMVVVTVHAVVLLRQSQIRIKDNIPNVRPAVIFPNIARADAEKNTTGMFKYLLNYGYYKFGLEISLIVMAACIAYRKDIVAVFFAFWLCLFVLVNRRQCAQIWFVFQHCTAAMIFLEYIVLIGLPPGFCFDYPWLHSKYSEGLQEWLLLPGNYHIDHSTKLFFDFMVLICISRQQRVFNIERSDIYENYPGGSNKSVVKDIAHLGRVPFNNPTRDFLANIRNYLDIFKNAIFCGFFWVTMAIVFLSGTIITNMLAFGYLIGAFIFLWEGVDIYLRPIYSLLFRWKILLLYNVFNIFIKTFLHICGCIYIDYIRMNHCWLIHMFGINCSGQNAPQPQPTKAGPNECTTFAHQTYLGWDALCFAFLIIQWRIFRSHYYCHMINDAKANSILASRGFEIIEDLRQKQIEHRARHEQEVLRKIKRKMEKIRATQQKMLRPTDKPTHYDEHGFPLPGSRVRMRNEPKYHADAIRAGDYYMFEDMDEKFELDLIDDETDFLEAEGKISDSEKKMNRRKIEINSPKIHFQPQRSYASAPECGQVKSSYEQGTIMSEPIAQRSLYCAEKPKTERPSVSRENISPEEEKPESTKKLGTDIPDATGSSDKSSEGLQLENPLTRLLEAFLISLAIRLNRFSRNYRYVNKILAEEKKAIKVSMELKPTDWNPSVYLRKTLASIDSDDEASCSSSSTNKALHNTQSDINIHTPITTNTTTTTTTTTTIKASQQNDPIVDAVDAPYSESRVSRMMTDSHISLSKAQERDTTTGVPEIRVMAPSLDQGLDDSISMNKQWSYEKVDSSGDFTFEEDFATRDHPIIVEVLISTWYAMLSNTDIICYFVVFINQVVSPNIITLPLPFMVLLWGTLSVPRPTKTFWVTLIAYTQAIVLVKCFIQFKNIWKNYYNIPLPSKPLSWAKLLGIEVNEQEHFDLLLLLVLLFHRFVLKSQGLWTSVDSEDYIEETVSRVRDLRSDNGVGEETDTSGLPDENVQRQQGGADQPMMHSSSSTPFSADYPSRFSEFKLNSFRNRYFSSLRNFMLNLRHKPRLPTDVYALMFLCDFINFFVLFFGYTSFTAKQGEVDGGVQIYLTENKVPSSFVIMLLLQFIQIVIDRALYLRKYLGGKIVFHYLCVIGIHIWMFFFVPAVTEAHFYSRVPPIIFYIIKCCSLLLSSYQIKCGFPQRILGNFLTKAFSIVNMLGFRFYMMIPFLYELRTSLDWVCTNTTMTLFDWLKMEDIFAEIYFIKCNRKLEQDFPAMRAEKKPIYAKLFLGGIFFTVIMVCIWGPLILFTFTNAVGTPNPPFEISVSIRIESYEPFYSISSREKIYPFSHKDYENLQEFYIENQASTAVAFISSYEPEDIAAIVLENNSPTMWSISQPDKDRLLSDLLSDKSLTFRFQYSISRLPPSKEREATVSDEITFEVERDFDGRQDLIKMLRGETIEKFIVIPEIFPKFIKVLNSDDLQMVSPLHDGQRYSPLYIKLHPSHDVVKSDWWELNETCILLPYADCKSLVIYTFNDKKFPSSFPFNYLTAGGIFGLYSTIVLVLSRVLKVFISGQTRRIMFEDLPYVDRVLQLCLDIYLVREALEFNLEEDLFAKLLFLYRSPETMIKWTRPKKITYEDETDTESLRSRVSARRIEHPQSN